MKIKLLPFNEAFEIAKKNGVRCIGDFVFGKISINGVMRNDWIDGREFKVVNEWSTEYVIKAINGLRLFIPKCCLKQSGLIDIVQCRENGKIKGWYIQVNYIISERKIEDVKIIVDSKNTQNLQVENPTNRNEDTNALRNNNKCLNNNSKMLKEKHIYRKNQKKEVEEPSFDIDQYDDYLNNRRVVGGRRMSDLISRQALLNKFNESKEIFDCATDDDIVITIRKDELSMYIAEVVNAPTVEERKHGHWNKVSPAGIYECSNCGKDVMTTDIECYRHCHRCGAIMDEESKDE